MLIDLQKSTGDVSLETEVCIVGAGAAGVALARDLMNAGRDVCLLEGGGMDYEDKTQSLFIGENIGMEYYDLDHSRLRFFGGTTNIWGGRSVTLDAIDFEKRDWVPHSGWPITLGELQDYYRTAHDSLELGEFDYEDANWEKLGLTPIAFDPQKIATRFWRFDDLAERFNSRRSEDLVKSANVRIVLHANAVALQARDNASGIKRLDALSLGGRKLQVVAKHYVLACGAIENARLLLASDSVEAAVSVMAMTNWAAISWNTRTAGSPISRPMTRLISGRIIVSVIRKRTYRLRRLWCCPRPGSRNSVYSTAPPHSSCKETRAEGQVSANGCT